MTEHVKLPGSHRAVPNAQFVANAAPGTPVELTVTLRPKEALPAEVDRSAPPMTLEQIEARYGASQDDARLVEKVLGEYGLKTGETSLGGRSMTLSGTVEQVEKAFGTKLSLFQSDADGEFRGRDGELEVPSELKNIVTGVFGLDTRRVAKPGRVTRPGLSQGAATETQGLMPADFARMYSFGSSKATGQIVGILEFGGAYVKSDLAQFCSDIGIPTPTVVAHGHQGQASDDATGEVMMDIQIAAAMAQGAQINVYFAAFTQKGWVNLLQHVIHGPGAKPGVFSISYGVAEDSGDFSVNGMKVIDGYFQEAAQMGITICISAGDDGCGSLEFDGKAHANFPASSPNVLAVGGTMLTGQSQEVTWWETPGRRFNSDGTNTGGGATGGGVSVVFPRPSWQTVTTKSLNDSSATGRCVPDVSALAGPPFYFLILNGATAPNGGTSASAPMWASVIACLKSAGKNVGFLPPVLYEDNGTGMTVGSITCSDITQGDNRSTPPADGYQAASGYDAVTGWGTPNVAALLNEPKI